MNPQVKEALAKANEIRIEMADIKKGIKSGEVDPVEVVQMCDLPITVFDVLNSIPSVGSMKARRAMEDLGLTDSHVIGGAGRITTRSGKHPINTAQKIRLAEYIGWRTTRSKVWRLSA